MVRWKNIPVNSLCQYHSLENFLYWVFVPPGVPVFTQNNNSDMERQSKASSIVFISEESVDKTLRDGCYLHLYRYWNLCHSWQNNVAGNGLRSKNKEIELMLNSSIVLKWNQAITLTITEKARMSSRWIGTKLWLYWRADGSCQLLNREL
jgi:hypothetical protein